MKLNLKVMSVLGIAAVVAVGGTFAYYTATDTFKNPFNTESFGTSSVEFFNPADGDNWEPGVKVDKAVFGMNEGEGDVYVRVFFEEEWTRTKEGDSDPTTLTKLGSNEDIFVPKESSIQPGLEGTTDGDIVEGKESVVFKTLKNVVDEEGRNTAQKWYKGSDGWYYYTSVLKSGETTELLLDGVQLAGDTDMGKYLDFAGFRKIPIKAKNNPKELANYKPELVVVDGKLVAKGNASSTATPSSLPEEHWYKMQEDGVDENGKKCYHIPTGIKEIKDAAGNKVGEEEVPVDIEHDNKPIDYNSDTHTFFSYEEHKLDQDHMGYANADYNLKITVEYIQADKDHAAVDSMTGEKQWEWYPDKPATPSEP